MIKYRLEIELLSPTLAGSGVGFGAAIDTDVVFDQMGIPFIPAKRIKGCLRDSAQEIQDMLSMAVIIENPIDIVKTFGSPGKEQPASVYFSNLTIPDYNRNRDWLRYFVQNDDYRTFVTPERIRETFTEIFQQTSINEDGIALEHSLRTIRVLKKGLKFSGSIAIEQEDEQIINTLKLACLNFQRLGTKRNRGFGRIRCNLRDNDGKLFKPDRLVEELCTL